MFSRRSPYITIGVIRRPIRRPRGKRLSCSACDGAEALDILDREPGTFQLLLADIRMPVMDGIALALAAARDHPGVIILLMTAYADQRERAYGLDLLIHDVITKPFALETVRAAVDQALAAGARRPR